MEAVVFNAYGNWGHFRKVDSNNNPLTHDLITKTALIGLIGAVVGIDRLQMRKLFPVLSEGIIYSVAVNSRVIKESWGFTARNIREPLSKAPKQFEFLRMPNYTIVIALKNEECKDVFLKFCDYLYSEKAIFTPVFGLHNCPANLRFINKGQFSDIKNGEFQTKGFISNDHKLRSLEKINFRIGFDKIPTFQNDDFWNLPDRYQSIVYSSEDSLLDVSGYYYELNVENEKSKWFLI